MILACYLMTWRRPPAQQPCSCRAPVAAARGWRRRTPRSLEIPHFSTTFPPKINDFFTFHAISSLKPRPPACTGGGLCDRRPRQPCEGLSAPLPGPRGHRGPDPLARKVAQEAPRSPFAPITKGKCHIKAIIDLHRPSKIHTNHAKDR